MLETTLTREQVEQAAPVIRALARLLAELDEREENDGS